MRHIGFRAFPDRSSRAIDLYRPLISPHARQKRQPTVTVVKHINLSPHYVLELSIKIARRIETNVHSANYRDRRTQSALLSPRHNSVYVFGTACRTRGR